MLCYRKIHVLFFLTELISGHVHSAPGEHSSLESSGNTDERNFRSFCIKLNNAANVWKVVTCAKTPLIGFVRNLPGNCFDKQRKHVDVWEIWIV